MGKYLDLDDVAAGNPKAERELAEMREQITELERQTALARDMVANAENLALKVQADYYRAMERIVKLEDALRPFAENGMAVSAIAQTNARTLLTQEEGSAR